MTTMQFVKPAGAVAAVALLGLAGLSITSPHVQADSDQSDSTVQIGFNVAPVQLNLKGLNRALVGKGSYLVNLIGDCNGCHQSPDIGPEYLPGGNPFFNQHPPRVNPASYLGGGRTFATFPTGAVIQSRNLTPDKTGHAEGGGSLEEFMTIMRTGKDFDHIHPPCPDTNHIGTDGCVQPFVGDGNLLQIMPWPSFSRMSDNDLQAIYEYLSAIPCIAHSPGAISVPATATTAAVPVLANVFNTCH